MNLTAMQEIAETAARQAGAHAMQQQDKIKTIEYKTEHQLVTEVDRACQAMIIATIRQHHPDHGILAEEGENGQLLKEPPQSNDAPWWVIDPIDGTRNYAHGLPLFAVSIGLMHKGIPILGVIYDPSTDTVFSAIQGQPAHRNEKPISCYTGQLHPNSQIALPGRYSHDLAPITASVMKNNVAMELGSAALQYAYVASGSFAGGCSAEVRLWDVAATAAIVQAAGGIMTTLDGTPRFPFDCDSYQGGPVPTITGGEQAVRQLAKLIPN